MVPVLLCPIRSLDNLLHQTKSMSFLPPSVDDSGQATRVFPVFLGGRFSDHLNYFEFLFSGGSSEGKHHSPCKVVLMIQYLTNREQAS